jgi:predicted alpha-1,6-mannanase (GH76 family)
MRKPYLLHLSALFILLSLTIMTSAQSATSTPDMSQPTDPIERATLAIEALQGWYDPETGLWETTNWWNAANSTYVLIDFSIRTGSETYLDEIDNTFEKHKAGEFLNEFYDDEGWWGLTWVHAYDLTGDTKYLEMAKVIFEDMTTGWDDVCGGGVWWKKDRQYKNAIPNELFLQLAAKLYNRTEDPVYLDWAERTWTWFKGTGMINQVNLINDGLRDCENNLDITWTYNQGVILGGLVELYKATGDEALLQQAEMIADAALEYLVDEVGVLREPCELSSNCGNDGPQFKGIFMRNLGMLYDAIEKPDYLDFINHNADKLWSRARNANNQIGLKWNRRADVPDAARQTSAIDTLLVAIRAVAD